MLLGKDGLPRCECGGAAYLAPEGYYICKECLKRVTKEGEVREAQPLPPEREEDFADMRLVCPHGSWRVMRFDGSREQRKGRWVVVPGEANVPVCREEECEGKWIKDMARLSACARR